MEYEWDPDKNAANIEKHGIDFNEAIGVLDDLVLEVPAHPAEGREPRWLATGIVNGRMVTVVYTWRGNSRRIISARKARPNEQTAYREKYRSEKGQNGLGPC